MREKTTFDIIIIGAGPAGMTAAIWGTGAFSNSTVLLLDRQDKIGKKILVTGNGRCNITNLDQKPDHYRTDDPQKAWDIFSKFDEKAVLHLMDRLGVYTKDRSGYVYPYNDQAAAVREAFEEYLKNLPGLTVRTGCGIADIRWDEDRKLFLLKADTLQTDTKEPEILQARSLIITTGGLAGTGSGCQGDGYRFARSFGHHIIPPLPALTALCSRAPFLKRLSGTRCQAEISVFADDTLLSREKGELQWTDYGISGVVVFSLSRFVIRALEEGRKTKAHIDFLPDLSRDHILAMFERMKNTCPYKDSRTFLNGLINHKLTPVILRESRIDENRPVIELNDADFHRLIESLKTFVLNLTGYKSFEKAQTTMGGVPLYELNDHMESRYQPGLFFAGELVDVDGTCGGYNLQWAFSSGKAAGEGALLRIM